jgi:hypothetical protein
MRGTSTGVPRKNADCVRRVDSFEWRSSSRRGTFLHVETEVADDKRGSFAGPQTSGLKWPRPAAVDVSVDREERLDKTRQSTAHTVACAKGSRTGCGEGNPVS